MKAQIEIKVGTATYRNEYIVGSTRAPRNYDYTGVVQIESNGPERIVAIPEYDVEMQQARYNSGLYNFLPLGDQDDADAVQEYLVDALVARIIT